MRNKWNTFLIFILGLASLAISLKIFWNNAIFVDETNSSASALYGGDFWLYMAWLRLFLLTGVVMLAGVRLLRKE